MTHAFNPTKVPWFPLRKCLLILTTLLMVPQSESWAVAAMGCTVEKKIGFITMICAWFNR
jgi:hypothetical protein